MWTSSRGRLGLPRPFCTLVQTAQSHTRLSLSTLRTPSPGHPQSNSIPRAPHTLSLHPQTRPWEGKSHVWEKETHLAVDWETAPQSLTCCGPEDRSDFRVHDFSGALILVTSVHADNLLASNPLHDMAQSWGDPCNLPTWNLRLISQSPLSSPDRRRIILS